MMIDVGVAPEQLILPQSMMTEWYWSGTLYAFARHVTRCSEDAQKESKEVADKIALHCDTLFPVVKVRSHKHG